MYQGVVLNPDSLVEEEDGEKTKTEQLDASITVRVGFIIIILFHQSFSFIPVPIQGDLDRRLCVRLDHHVGGGGRGQGQVHHQ